MRNYLCKGSVHVNRIKLLFSFMGKWALIDCLIMLVSSIISGTSVVIIQTVIDKLPEFLMHTDKSASAIALILGMCAFLFINELINAVCNFMAIPTTIEMELNLNNAIHKKMSKLNAISFEDDTQLTVIDKAKVSAEGVRELYHAVSTLLFFYVPYFVIMMICFVNLSPILLLSIGFVFVPQIISQMIRVKINSTVIDESIPYQRKEKYFRKELTQVENIKENRILGIGQFLLSKFCESQKTYCSLKWQSIVKIQKGQIAAGVILAMGYVGILLIAVTLTYRQALTIGGFTAVIASINTLFNYSKYAVNGELGKTFEYISSLKKLNDFFILKEDMGKEFELDYENDILVKNLSFKYPNTNDYVLKNITFSIKTGETIALVGENGSGKTTLSRILLGLFVPTEGSVHIGRTDINSIDPEYRFRKMTALFQNYQRYKLSLADNICISRGKIEFDERYYWRAKKTASVSTEIQDEDMLSREFGGKDLSGGNWQRIALARTMYRNADFVVLDEPTSAIDPLEESLLFSNFEMFLSDKTAVVVTHRLGLTKIADKILVLKNGELSEFGTHEELIYKKGSYYEMYKKQARWYATN